jgi:hypothetical protein
MLPSNVALQSGNCVGWVRRLEQADTFPDVDPFACQFLLECLRDTGNQRCCRFSTEKGGD